MKTLIPFATVLLHAACAAPPRMEAPLQAQAPAPMGMEGPSSIGQNIIGYKHSRYANQPNEVNNALWGAALGAGAGQAIGHDTESTVYGAAAGTLGGYFGSKLIR